MNTDHKYYLTADLSNPSNEVRKMVNDDKEEDIKYLACIAKNETLPENIQNMLSRSRHTTVKLHLINNTKITDKNLYNAIFNLKSKSQSQILSNKEKRYKEIPFTAQLKIINQNNYLLRLKLTKNFILSKTIQYNITQDEHYSVRAALANNKSITNISKKALLKDNNIQVKIAILDSPFFFHDEKIKIKKELLNP